MQGSYCHKNHVTEKQDFIGSKQLTKSTALSGFAAGLMALDCMHLTRKGHRQLAEKLAGLVPALLS